MDCGPGKESSAAPRCAGRGWPAPVSRVPEAVEPSDLPDAKGCWCSSGVSPERDDSPGYGAGTRARCLNYPFLRRLVLSMRKRRSSSRLPGSLLFRFGAWQFLALLFQLPRRFTRFELGMSVTPIRGRPRTAARGPCGYQRGRHARPCRARSGSGRLHRCNPGCSALRRRASFLPSSGTSL